MGFLKIAIYPKSKDILSSGSYPISFGGGPRIDIKKWVKNQVFSNAQLCPKVFSKLKKPMHCCLKIHLSNDA